MVWDRRSRDKTGLRPGLARCGLGLAGLVLFCETRSCHSRHNDLEGHSNFSSTIYSFSMCKTVAVRAQLPECGAATCSVLSASSSSPVNNMNCTRSAQRHSTRLTDCPNRNSRHSRLGCDLYSRLHISTKCLCLLPVVLVLVIWSWSCKQWSWSQSCYFGLNWSWFWS